MASVLSSQYTAAHREDKGKGSLICIALSYVLSKVRYSGITHVNERSHSFACHPHVYPQMECAIPVYSPAADHACILAGTQFSFH